MSFRHVEFCMRQQNICQGANKATIRPLPCKRSDCDFCGPKKAETILARIHEYLPGCELSAITVSAKEKDATLKSIKRNAEKFITFKQEDGNIVIVTTDKLGEMVGNIDEFVLNTVSTMQPIGTRWRTNLQPTKTEKEDAEKRKCAAGSFINYRTNATTGRIKKYMDIAAQRDIETHEKHGVTICEIDQSTGQAAMIALENSGCAVERRTIFNADKLVTKLSKTAKLDKAKVKSLEYDNREK